MRNRTIIILGICLFVLSSCVNTNEVIEKEVVAKNNASQINVENNSVDQLKTIENPITKVDIQNQIQKNHNIIKEMGKEIDALLKDF